MNQAQRYLLDTDICVYLLNGNERIKERIAITGLGSIAALRKTGQIIGDMDLLIASVAVSRSLIVVTNNTRHFDRIPELKVENWLEQ